MHLENHVKFITDDVAIEEYVNAAEAVVLPYLNLNGTEGNPSCLLEAMACKTIAVTTEIPEIMETAQETVITSVPADPLTLAASIEKAITLSSDIKKNMVDSAYILAQEQGVGKITEKCIDIYTKIKST